MLADIERVVKLKGICREEIELARWTQRGKSCKYRDCDPEDLEAVTEAGAPLQRETEHVDRYFPAKLPFCSGRPYGAGNKDYSRHAMSYYEDARVLVGEL